MSDRFAARAGTRDASDMKDDVDDDARRCATMRETRACDSSLTLRARAR
jgi:hypothetical protein